MVKISDTMATFKDILKSAFTDTASLVHVTPDYVEIDRSWDRPEFHAGCVRSSSSLTARGSVALSRLPVVTDEERAARKARVLAYDFSSDY